MTSLFSAALIAAGIGLGPDRAVPPQTVPTLSRGHSFAPQDFPLEEILSRSDVLLLGERHTSLSSLSLLTRLLPRLKASGVSVLGLEGISTSLQGEMDRYFAAPRDAALVDYLAFSRHGDRDEKLKSLLIAAKEAQIRVVAIDIDAREAIAEIARVAAQLSGRPASDFPTTFQGMIQRSAVDGLYGAAYLAVARRQRDFRMAAVLRKILPRGSKAVALVGSNHIGRAQAVSGETTPLTMATQLMRLGLKAFSINTTGGLHDHGTVYGPHLPDALEGLMEQAVAEGLPAFLRTSAATAIYRLPRR